jgi:hypothetical protein
MAETAWLDLPFVELTKENVRAEAARRGLPFRKLMDLYYRQDPERAIHLSLYWKVAPRHPEELFGKTRVGQFVGDVRKFLADAKIRITTVSGEDPHGLDQMQEVKKERQARDLQEQQSRQGPGEPTARKRKRGGNRTAKNARRRARQVPDTLPPPADSLRYEDRDGSVLRFTTSGVQIVEAAKPPTKRSRKRARRSPSTSSSSSSASSSSYSSSSSVSSVSSLTSSMCDRIFASSSSSSSSSESSSPSEDEDLPRAEPSAPTKGDGAVPAAEAASPSPELEILYSKPPEQVDNEQWTKAFRRALPAEEEREPRL